VSTTAIGLAVIAFGIVLILVGILIAVGAFSWVGRLPGDIRIESDSVKVFIPITSMLLISLLLTVAVNILRRLLR
jgi:uncharacterized protein HemY